VSRVSLGLLSRRSEYGRRLSLARGLESRGAIVFVIVKDFVRETVDGPEPADSWSNGL
jgi:hypothetical protein